MIKADHTRHLLTFTRYGLVQVLAYGVDMGSFLLLARLLPLFDAGALSRGIAGLLAFFCHKLFTFRQKDSGTTRREAVRYFVLLIVMMPLAAGLLVLFSNSMDKVPAKILADALCIVISFLLTRTFVFIA